MRESISFCALALVLCVSVATAQSSCGFGNWSVTGVEPCQSCDYPYTTGQTECTICPISLITPSSEHQPLSDAVTVLDSTLLSWPLLTWGQDVCFDFSALTSTTDVYKQIPFGFEFITDEAGHTTSILENEGLFVITMNVTAGELNCWDCVIRLRHCVQYTATGTPGSWDFSECVQEDTTTPPLPTPFLNTAALSPSATELVLSMTRPTDIGQSAGISSPADMCAHFLDADTLTALSAGSSSGLTCFWTDEYTLVVRRLGDQFPLGQNVTVTANTLVSGSISSFVQTADQTQPITPPSPITEVSGALVGPTKIGSCEDLVLSAEGSSGTGGRELVFAWTVESLTGGVPTTDLTNNVNFTDSLSNTTLVVPRTAFPGGSSFRFNVTVSNWLGSSVSMSITVEKVDLALPAVFMVDGSSRSVAVNAPFRSEVAIVPLDCINLGTLNFVWTQLSGPSVTASDAVLDQKALQIPAYAFQAGSTYVFEANVTSTSFPNLWNVASVTITTTTSDLLMQLKGETMSVPVSKDFVLSAGDSRNPDVLGDVASRDSITYTWSCKRQVSGADCFTDSVTVLNSNTVPHELVIDSAYLFQSFSDPLVITVTGTTTSPARSSSASATVNVIGEEVPVVYAYVTDSSEKLSVGQKITLLSQVANDSLSSQTDNSYTWSISGNLNLSDPQVMADSLLVADLHQDSLVFAPNALSAGSAYTITLSVTRTNSTDGSTVPGVGEASVVIQTNQAPQSGGCTVSPSSGTMLTPFTLSCSGWTDDPADLPLEYQIVTTTQDGDGSPFDVPIGLFSAKNAYTTLLPLGSDVTVNFQIRDQLGESTSVQVNVTVNEADSDAVTDALSTALNEAVAIGDMATVASYVMSGMTLITASSSGASPISAALMHQHYTAQAWAPESCAEMYRVPAHEVPQHVIRQLNAPAHPNWKQAAAAHGYEILQSTLLSADLGLEHALRVREDPEHHHYLQEVWVAPEGTRGPHRLVHSRRLHALDFQQELAQYHQANPRHAVSASAPAAPRSWWWAIAQRATDFVLGTDSSRDSNSFGLQDSVLSQGAPRGHIHYFPRMPEQNQFVAEALDRLDSQDVMFTRDFPAAMLRTTFRKQYHAGHLGSEQQVYTVAVRPGTCQVLRVFSALSSASGELAANLTSSVVTSSNNQLGTSESTTQGASVLSSTMDDSESVSNSSAQSVSDYVGGATGSMNDEDSEVSEELVTALIDAIGKAANAQFAQVRGSTASSVADTASGGCANMSKALGALMQPGESQLTISRPDLSLGVVIADESGNIGNVSVNDGITFQLGSGVLNEPSITAQLVDDDDRVGLAMFLFHKNLYQFSGDFLNRNLTSKTGTSGLVLFRTSDFASLEVHNLSVPVDIVFSGLALTQKDNPSCRFWNESTDQYDTSGCTYAVNRSSLNTTVCECNHLTSYNMGAWTEISSFSDLFPGFNWLSWEDFNVSWSDIEKEPLPFIIALSLFFLYLLALTISWAVERKRFSAKNVYKVFKKREIKRVNKLWARENEVLREYFGRSMMAERASADSVEDVVDGQEGEEEDDLQVYDDLADDDQPNSRRRRRKRRRIRRRGKRIAIGSNLADDTSDDETQPCCQRICRKTGKGLWYDHLWISICTRRFDDGFTGPQRVTVVFCFMYTVLLASAFFFGQDGASVASSTIAGFLIPWFALPIVMLLTYLFYHIGPEEPDTEMYMAMERARKDREWRDWLAEYEKDPQAVMATAQTREEVAMTSPSVLSPQVRDRLLWQAVDSDDDAGLDADHKQPQQAQNLPVWQAPAKNQQRGQAYAVSRGATPSGLHTPVLRGHTPLTGNWDDDLRSSVYSPVRSRGANSGGSALWATPPSSVEPSRLDGVELDEVQMRDDARHLPLPPPPPAAPPATQVATTDEKDEDRVDLQALMSGRVSDSDAKLLESSPEQDAKTKEEDPNAVEDWLEKEWAVRKRQLAVSDEVVRLDQHFAGKTHFWDQSGEWHSRKAQDGPVTFTAREGTWRQQEHSMRDVAGKRSQEQLVWQEEHVEGCCAPCVRGMRWLGRQRYPKSWVKYTYALAWFYMALMCWFIIIYGNMFSNDEDFAEEAQGGHSVTSTWIMWACIGVAQDVLLLEPMGMLLTSVLQVMPCSDYLEDIYEMFCCCLGLDFTS